MTGLRNHCSCRRLEAIDRGARTEFRLDGEPVTRGMASVTCPGCGDVVYEWGELQEKWGWAEVISILVTMVIAVAACVVFVWLLVVFTDLLGP